ncbi:MAG: YeeE/YedE thiosulfate transporter family protein [Rhodospirillales bacterium]
MGLIENVIIGLLMGIVFGVALEKSRVFEPGVIVGQMQLRNFIMLKVFLTAVVTGLAILIVLTATGQAKLSPKAVDYFGNIVGGLIFGAGIVLAGACPGTVMAQIGAGYKDAWAVLAGGILGAMVYGYAEPWIAKTLLADGGKLTLHQLTGTPYWLLAPIAAAVLIGVLVALERRRPWRREVGKDYDGVR